MRFIAANLRRFGLALLTMVLVASFASFLPAAATRTVKLGSDGMLVFDPQKTNGDIVQQ